MHQFVSIALLSLLLSACDINPYKRKEFSYFFNQSVDLTDNLIFYHFNEESYSGTAGDIIDSSGRGRHCDSVNGLTKAQGIFGEGIYCDGSGSGIDLNLTEFDDGFDERTISVWFYAEKIDGTRYIYEEGGTVNGINIYIINGILYGHTYKGFPGSIDFQVHQSMPVSAETWYHVVITYHKDNGFLMFVNGDSIAPAESLNGFTFPSHGDPNGLCFQNGGTVRHDGSSGGSSYSNPFQGVLDEIAVWNRTLNPDEVNDLYLRQGRL
jgi:hypothetical protein